MHRVDLNCDMGESFGAYRLGQDEIIMREISSANIACGFHAGDPGMIRDTVKLAISCGVAIGAHPGLPDLAGFGRRRMEISPREAYEMIVYQMGAVQAFARSEGTSLAHVKPHGALYNMAAQDDSLAEAIAEAVYKVDGNALLYGLAGSALIRAAEKIGLAGVREVFADRSYEADGSLTHRSLPGAVIHDSEAAAARVVDLILSGEVVTRQGTPLALQADTVCVHGDTPDAYKHVLALRKALSQANIEVQSPRQILR
ncbi:LamB/YcsF family protein [Paenibacillus sp. 1011MAR3C5]|uniref:LamB/YcsF family protein n=1 Tax=Paenibacillus sp. 1011MAR3C5 TaxID=1675787 RepID=UPI000E6D5098|nr:5-oxoprolinase subunit PxpA [Paenibacillus sp. 1011MAR3C5]RJE89052.1 LamB/YcsF family protein [Paenibacillus sp. 1011MAR3C5]